MEAREEELANAPSLTGILDILPEGYGFLRTSGFLPGPTDVYASVSQIRRFGLRKGDTVTGAIRQAKDNEKYAALLRIDSVNGMTNEEAQARPVFDKLTPLFPDERFHLETSPTDVTGRIIDMVRRSGRVSAGWSSRRPRRARPPCSRTSRTGSSTPVRRRT